MARFVQTGLVCVALALVSCFGLVGSAQAQVKRPIEDPTETVAAPESAYPTLESLLQESGFAYRKLEDGSFRITVESNGTPAFVVAQEVTMGWKDSQGNDVRIVFLYRWIADLPQGEPRSAELLSAVSELNTGRYIGRVCVNDYGLFVANSFFLRTADAESLADELVLANNDAVYALNFLSEIIDGLNNG